MTADLGLPTKERINILQRVCAFLCQLSSRVQWCVSASTCVHMRVEHMAVRLCEVSGGSASV